MTVFSDRNIRSAISRLVSPSPIRSSTRFSWLDSAASGSVVSTFSRNSAITRCAASGPSADRPSATARTASTTSTACACFMA